jgi:hypothetical protein
MLNNSKSLSILIPLLTAVAGAAIALTWAFYTSVWPFPVSSPSMSSLNSKGIDYSTMGWSEYMSTPLSRLFGYANRTLIMDIRFNSHEQEPTLTIYHTSDEFDRATPGEFTELPNNELAILLMDEVGMDETRCGKFLYLIDMVDSDYRRMDFVDCYLHTLQTGQSYIIYRSEDFENSSAMAELQHRDFSGEVLAETSIPEGYIFFQSLLSPDGTKVAILTRGQEPDQNDINNGRRVFIWDLSSNILSDFGKGRSRCIVLADEK